MSEPVMPTPSLAVKNSTAERYWAGTEAPGLRTNFVAEQRELGGGGEYDKEVVVEAAVVGVGGTVVLGLPGAGTVWGTAGSEVVTETGGLAVAVEWLSSAGTKSEAKSVAMAPTSSSCFLMPPKHCEVLGWFKRLGSHTLG